jgi:cytoskeletal protein CcmA (bactofilin family)
MWNKDDQRNEPVATAPTAPAPSRPAPTSGGGQPAYIGKSISIEGTITGSDDLVIEGRVKGSIKLSDNMLTIGSNGVVEADVEAKEIRVQGKLNGATKARDRIEIGKTGSVEGEVTTSRIAVEDGAVFRGSVNIATPEGK